MSASKVNINSCSANANPPSSKSKNSLRKNLASTAIFNTKLVWGPGQYGTISVSFNTSDGAWSQVGKDSNTSYPSMNLGWVDPPADTFTMDGFTFDGSLFNETGLDENGNTEFIEHRNYCNYMDCSKLSDPNYICVGENLVCSKGWQPGSVIIHEFGHSLGMYHEHQNYLNGNPIEYDLDGATLFSLSQRNNPKGECVQDYCKSMCFSSDINPYFCKSGCDKNVNFTPDCLAEVAQAREDATTNVLEKYNCTSTVCDYAGSSFDNSSVMLYTVDDYMLKPDVQGKRNNPTKINFVYSDTDKEWLARMYPVDNPNKPVLTVKFTQGPDWKKYWVKKVIMESLAPCVGVKFVFDLPVKTPSVFTSKCPYKLTPMETNPPAPGTGNSDGTGNSGITGGSTSSAVINEISDTSASITIVFGYIILALIIIGVIIGMYKLFYKNEEIPKIN